jgi:predicted nucleic acid-binding Zn ribbon protein
VDGAADETLPDIPTRRWAKTDARQQRILDAATVVFAARGFTWRYSTDWRPTSTGASKPPRIGWPHSTGSMRSK